MNRPGVCRSCGARVRFVEIIPLHPTGQPPKAIPLDVVFDPSTSPIPASHALSPRGTACHPITPAWPIGPEETPALTHFATCTAKGRRPARKPTRRRGR